MRNTFKLFFTVLAGLLFSITAQAQTKKAIISNHTTCTTGDSITVNVSVENITNIGSITFKISYNPAVLQCGRIFNVFPGLQTKVDNIINPSGAYYLSWAEITPINPGTAILFSMRFKHLGGSSAISFSPNDWEAEITDDVGNVYAVTYISGGITQGVIPVATITPTGPTTFCQGDSVKLDATTGVGFTYVWKKNGNTITGATSATYYAKENGSYTVEITSADNCTSVSSPEIVTVNPKPVYTQISPLTINMCYGDSTQYHATITGTSPWVVLVTSSKGNMSITVTSSPWQPWIKEENLGTQTYNIVSVTDANNCVSSIGSTLSITLNPLPTPNAGTDDVICAGDNKQLGSPPTAGHTYDWSSIPAGFTSNNNNPTVNPTVTTTYILTETITSTGCTAKDTVVITALPLPDAIITPTGSTTICAGDSVKLNANTGTGYTYVWKLNGNNITGATGDYIYAKNAGNYTVEVTAPTLCKKLSAPVTVVVNPKPTASTTTPSDVYICYGDSTQFNITLTGASPWLATVTDGNPPTTMPIATSPWLPWVKPNATKTYSILSITDANNCSNTVNISITVHINPLPAAITGSNVAICFGGNTQIGAAPVAGNSYSWTSIPAGFTSSISNPTVNPTVTTTYTLTETVTATGCSKTNSVVVTVNPVAPANTGSDRAICINASTTLGAPAVAGNSYSWVSNPVGFTSNLAEPTVNPTVTTTYTLTQTVTATGCVSTGSVVVTVNPLPNANTGSNATICLNASTQIGAAPVTGNAYSWTSNPAGFTSSVSNPTVNPTVTTTYTLVETITATGCSKSNTVVVQVNPLPAATTGSNSAICLNASTQIGAAPVTGNTYSWTSNPAGFTSSVSNPTVNPTVTTTYTLVETITATGCSKTGSVVITVNPLPNANAGANRTICSGSSTQIGQASVSGNTYSWTSTPAGYTSTSANPTVSPTVTTTYTLVQTITATGCNATSSVVVTVNPLPAANAGTPATVCSGTSVQIGAAAVTGNTYSWTSTPAGFTSSVSNPTVNPTVTTTYTLTETITATTCSKTGTVVITVNPLPAAAGGPDKAVCFGNSTQIGPAAVTGNTYSWVSVPAGYTSTTSNPIVSPSVTTTYILTETVTATTCSKTDTVVVTVNPLPNPSFTGLATSYCVDASAATLVPTPAGGYFVGVGITANTFSPSTAGVGNHTITYMYTDANGCFKSVNQSTTVHALPNVSFTGLGTAYCGNLAPVALTGNPTGGTFTGNGITGSTFNPAVALKDTLLPIKYTYQDANGCVNSATQMVIVFNNPTPNAGSASTINCGQSTTLGGSSAVPNVIYSWTPATGLSATNIYNPVANPLVTTTYTLTATDTITGCSGTATVVVTVNPITTVNAGTDTIVCAGTPVTRTATGASTYVWSNNATTASITVTPTVTTTYTVTGTTTNGCTGTDYFVVTVNPLPVVNAGADVTTGCGMPVQIGSAPVTGQTYSWTPTTNLSNATIANPMASPNVTTQYIVNATITATGCQKSDTVLVTVTGGPVAFAGHDTTICPNTSATLTATGGTGYLWSTGGTTATITVSPSVTTTYTVTVSDATACQSIDTVVVNVKVLNFDLGPDTAVCRVPKWLDAGAGWVTYNWSTGATTRFALIDTTGLPNVPSTDVMVYCTVTDADGCQATDSIKITFVDCSGVQDITNDIQINVFPNPSKGLFNYTVQVLGKTTLDICIMNMKGQLVNCEKQQNINSPNVNGQFDLSNLPKGVYFMRFRTDKITKIEKIIIQ